MTDTTKYPLAARGSVVTPFPKKYFVKTGEVRPPKKGEYYLSGAIPEVYVAPNDLNTSFHIMREIEPPPQVIVRDGFRYRLIGPE